MRRKPRIHFPGAVYLGILRGNAGGPIFFQDLDRFRHYIFKNHSVTADNSVCKLMSNVRGEISL